MSKEQTYKPDKNKEFILFILHRTFIENRNINLFLSFLVIISIIAAYNFKKTNHPFLTDVAFALTSALFGGLMSS
ncbi:MAG: hypothetical protein ACD_20C00089G0006 [uncultured bacterium]|nr:MAG: hypothetical protein ACD_20C00089G0006 [uncultured bacterium]HBH18557.1 hypothetical protein [Cyanobacteria bacterium UBA9579]